MVPPFLAYYGVTTANQSMVREAYTQCKLYMQYLRDTSAKNLWQHIVMGSGTDPGHWSMGYALAAAGMLRVPGTILHSPYSSGLKDLVNWIWKKETQHAMYGHVDTGSWLFWNYAEQMDGFLDTSSTALMTSTVHRMSLSSSSKSTGPPSVFHRYRPILILILRIYIYIQLSILMPLHVLLHGPLALLHDAPPPPPSQTWFTSPPPAG